MVQKMKYIGGFFLFMGVIGSFSLFAMHEAAEQNNMALVKKLLAEGIDVNSADEEGETPLFKAARNGYKAIVRLLLENGGDPLYLNNKGQKARDIVYVNDYEFSITAEVLKEAELEWKKKLYSNQQCASSSLCPAAQQTCSFSGVRTFFDTVGKISRSKDQQQFFFEGESFKERFDEALFKGLELDYFKKERAAYMVQRIAVYKKIGEISSQPIRVVQATKKGLKEAAKEGETAQVLSWLKNGQKKRPDTFMANEVQPALQFAASGGKLETIKAIFDAFEGIDVQAVDRNGLTTLHWAAINGNADIIIFYVEKGANVNAQDNSGQTPLMKAAQGGHFEAIKALLKNGADVNIRAATTFTLSYEDGNEDTFSEDSDIDRLFKEKTTGRAIAKETGGKGRTALHMIVRMAVGSTKKSDKQIEQETAAEIVKLLMKHGANMYITDIPWRASVVDWVVYNKQDKLFEVLIEGRRKQLGIKVVSGKGKKKA